MRPTPLLLLLGLCFTCLLAQAEPPTFTPIFDGKTLNGWHGDPPYWSVRNGAILGQITPNTLIDRNRFLVYQGELPDDFELLAEYRVSAKGNSGINYRSEVLEDVDFVALRGYQCDLDGRLRYTGSNYEERRRTTLARVGESVVIPSAGGAKSLAHVEGNAWQKREIEPLEITPDKLKGLVHTTDWNRVRIVADGNRLEHYINDQLVSQVVDNDTVNRRLSGKLGVQVHVGPPMTIEYRNLRIRALNAQRME